MTPLSSDAEHIDRVWADDLLARRDDGRAVQTFLLRRSAALTAAGRPGAYTLAIDAPYGAGKTFFLRRMLEQVRRHHPAAFIDAWADDTIDAPWTALVVAIDEALKPYASKLSPAIKSGIKKRGMDLITALAKGAAKKGASYVVGEEGWDDAVDALFEKRAEQQVDDFKDRKKAVEALKEILQEVLSSLPDADVSTPMFIFIDELDRCRPTYAIRFLEEIKHIFDVPGTVFVLATHDGQLQKSVAALYGQGFDTHDYLRRFIDKTYRLHVPSMDRLVLYHINSCAMPLERFAAPRIEEGLDPVPFFISRSLEYWGVNARDAIGVVDALTTCEAIWKHNVPLQLELLLPLVIRNVLGLGKAELESHINQRRVYRWTYQPSDDDGLKDPREIFEKFWGAKNWNFYHYQNAGRIRGLDSALNDILIREHQLRAPLDSNSSSLMSEYPTLVERISDYS